MTSKYPILDHLSVSTEELNNWQKTADLIAEIINVPAALIMRVHADEIEVFVRSSNEDNVYKAGERAPLDTGLYCETVMTTRNELLVANALRDPLWDHNPDIELGMIAYYGLPLTWPTGEIFGTLCILDVKENSFSDKYRELMKRFRDSVQFSIAAIYDSYQKDSVVVQAKEQVQILSQALEQSPLSIVITDSNAKIKYVNPAFEHISGYRARDVIGKNPKIFQSGKTPENIYAELWSTIKSKQSWDGDILNRRKNGELYWEHAHISPVLDKAGKVGHYLAIKEDISYQKQQAEIILHQALYDPLTQLPNRALLLDRLKLMLIDARREDHRVAVLFVDLDDFKKVNDSLGHEEGDKLLIEAAQRLQNALRDGDTVGRFGGDEFVILLGDIVSVSDVQPVAETLLEQFRNVFQLNNRELLTTVSVGVAVYPDDGTNPSELLRNADSAMYYAKEQGRNIYSYYTHAMNQEVSRRLALEEQMHGALERSEFSIHYQPQVDVVSRRICGIEALLRWNNPVLGDVSPDEFISIAEQTGLIATIGEFVLTESLSAGARLQQISKQPFTIAVNLSPVQFRNPKLIEQIEQAIKQSGISSSSLELEITEGVFMSGHAHINDTLALIDDLGVNISMDDFGTGYSSLSYLRNYPFHVLKIDRSFINDITVDPADRALVNAAIAMAHSLDLKVVAEGVETEEQWEHLVTQGCDMAQGYLFSKPVSAEEIAAMLYIED